MKTFIYILSIVAIFGFTSCEKEEIDPGMAPNSELAGTWTVTRYSVTDMSVLSGTAHLYTYNTSSDANSIWVDNHRSTYFFKVKAGVLSNTTFGTTEAADDYHNSHFDAVTLSEAQIFGDSIAIRVTLLNPDGSVDGEYYEAGHRTTGEGNDTH